MRVSDFGGSTSSSPTNFDTAYSKPVADTATVQTKRTTYAAPKPYVAPKPKATYTAPKQAVHSAPITATTSNAIATPTDTPAPAPAPAPSSPSYDDLMNKYYNSSMGDINKLYDQQQANQLSALKSQRDTALKGINQQKANTTQQYYDQRNAADVVNLQNAQKLRELMGQNGLLDSGSNITATARLNADRQNSLNSLNVQEQAKMNDYANQINTLNDPSKDKAITDQIAQERTKALLDAKNTAGEKAWRDYTYNNMSAAQKAQMDWSKQQFGENMAWQLYNQQYQGNLQSAQNQAMIDGYNSQPSGFNGSQGGGGTAQFNSDLAKANSRGLDPAWNSAITWVTQHESGFNPNAKNPTSTAHGYAQFLNSTANEYQQKTGLSYNDPVNQLIMEQQYMKDRYGTPQGAVNFWKTHNWY